MCGSIRCLLCNHKDLNSIPRTLILKSQADWCELAIPALELTGQPAESK